MNIEHHKTQLLEKQRELTDELSRLKDNARDARTAEVEDPMDYVTSSETQATALVEGSMTSDTLNAIAAALTRIDDGTYGFCVDCGREIEPARLEAVPWTPFCLEDKEKHEREATGTGSDELETVS